MTRTRGEVLRQCADAGADLEHRVFLREFGGINGRAEDIVINEEVLTELLPGADIVFP